MRPVRCIVCFFLLLTGMAVGQTAYTVEVGKTLPVDIPGATAAYALSSETADASFSNGAVRITGIYPGKTTVIVITPAGMKTLQVAVAAPASSGTTESNGAHNEFGNYSLPVQLRSAAGHQHSGLHPAIRDIFSATAIC